MSCIIKKGFQIIDRCFVFELFFKRWDELGMYDLPASIDYVLKETGHKKVSYVGYSLGSAVYFVGANLKPELNDKIEVVINLAPTSTVQRLDNLFKLIAPLSNPLKVSGHFDFKCRGSLAILHFPSQTARHEVDEDRPVLAK